MPIQVPGTWDFGALDSFIHAKLLAFAIHFDNFRLYLRYLI